LPRRFQVRFSPKAGRDLKKLRRYDARTFQRIWAAILAMETDPTQGDLDRVEDEKGVVFRRRVGDHRILFEFDGESLIILLLRIRKRDEVYSKKGKGR
jgi:mRNA interferase RelE/StbE